MFMRKLNLLRPLLTGLITGTILGLFLKVVEAVTSIKVYTLLLNVDYVPLLNRFDMPEWGGFAIHLGISTILSYCLFFFLNFRNWRTETRFWLVVMVSVLIGLFLYPTTLFSDQTPSLLDGRALGFWLIGHLLYGCMLGKLLFK